MHDFDGEMEALQVRWRQRRVNGEEQGVQNGVSRPWILPAERWEEGLFQELRIGQPLPLQNYLAQHRITRHAGSHNLKSSWISGVNLYFPFGRDDAGRQLLAAFLAERVDARVHSVEKVELEYAGEGELSPEVLLGERGGTRGSAQTSPDIAFVVNGGAGLLLVENKLTEHSFYRCSARRTEGSGSTSGQSGYVALRGRCRPPEGCFPLPPAGLGPQVLGAVTGGNRRREGDWPAPLSGCLRRLPALPSAGVGGSVRHIRTLRVHRVRGRHGCQE